MGDVPGAFWCAASASSCPQDVSCASFFPIVFVHLSIRTSGMESMEVATGTQQQTSRRHAGGNFTSQQGLDWTCFAAGISTHFLWFSHFSPGGCQECGWGRRTEEAGRPYEQIWIGCVGSARSPSDLPPVALMLGDRLTDHPKPVARTPTQPETWNILEWCWSETQWDTVRLPR